MSEENKSVVEEAAAEGEVVVPVIEQQAEAPVSFWNKPVGKDKKPLWRELVEWVVTIGVAVAIALVVRTFLFELVRVDGHSMDYTLADKEVMYVSKLDYVTGPIERFDVVICHYPGRGSTNFVKRVVGLPGDKVAVEPTIDEQGNVYGALYVNGERIDEPYITNRINYYLVNHWDTARYNERYTVDNPYVVPEGKYFVLGDNRSNSNDSHLQGPLDREMILGHVKQIIFPFNAWRGIE